MVSIKERYYHIATQMVKNSRHAEKITEESTYQESIPENRVLINQILDDLVLPESSLAHGENLKELYDRAQAGESALILMEHYSNFDIPCLYYFLERQGEPGQAIADSIVSMAGMKLNEESSFVRAFSEGYTRIVIYPSRSLDRITDPDKAAGEQQRARVINLSALREMVRQKHEGRLILVFPSGTRYRPGEPDTKRVLKTVDSYIKSFDNMVLIGITGNVLLVNPSGDMTSDYVQEDVVSYAVSPVFRCDHFRDKVRTSAAPEIEAREAVARAVEAELEKMHNEAERHRQDGLHARP